MLTQVLDKLNPWSPRRLAGFPPCACIHLFLFMPTNELEQPSWYHGPPTPYEYYLDRYNTLNSQTSLASQNCTLTFASCVTKLNTYLSNVLEAACFVGSRINFNCRLTTALPFPMRTMRPKRRGVTIIDHLTHCLYLVVTGNTHL